MFRKHLLIMLPVVLISCSSGTHSATTRLGYFQKTKQEILKPTRWDVGDTTITNEDRLDLFTKHIKDLKGGYIGVGSSQNLSLAAWAQSEWVWLMDFTRIVVAVNTINIAFISESATPADFRKLWQRKNKNQAEALIRRHFQSKSNLNFLIQSWHKSRAFQERRFSNDDINYKKHNSKLWLYDQNLYNHIRNLAIKGRIQAVHGDLRGHVTLKSIASQARQMELPVRIAYFSNAEEYFDLDGQFRSNWLDIPFDQKSVIVRTISVDRWNYPWAPGSELSTNRGFHYNIQNGLNYQLWLKDSPPKLRTRHILKMGQIDKKNGFSSVNKGP